MSGLQSETLLKNGAITVQRLPRLWWVTASDPQGKGSRENQLFRVLLRYIRGQNESESRLPMTAPVLISTGETTAVTFLFWEKIPPKPCCEEQPLSREEHPSQLVAILRFTGLLTSKRIHKRVEELKGWAQANGIEGSTAYLARYDPPWTPPFLRRNEIWLSIASSSRWGPLVLVYDDECSWCRKWIEQMEMGSDGSLTFAARTQSQALLKQHPELDVPRALVAWNPITKESWTGGEAVRQAMGRCPQQSWWAPLVLRCPISLLNWVYRRLASMRPVRKKRD